MKFTEQEVEAIRHVIRDYAASKGEDIIGIILYSGAFLHLPDREEQPSVVVDLAKKLEHSDCTK